MTDFPTVKSVSIIYPIKKIKKNIIGVGQHLTHTHTRTHIEMSSKGFLFVTINKVSISHCMLTCYRKNGDQWCHLSVSKDAFGLCKIGLEGDGFFDKGYIRA